MLGSSFCITGNASLLSQAFVLISIINRLNLCLIFKQYELIKIITHFQEFLNQSIAFIIVLYVVSFLRLSLPIQISCSIFFLPINRALNRAIREVTTENIGSCLEIKKMKTKLYYECDHANLMSVIARNLITRWKLLWTRGIIRVMNTEAVERMIPL